jgi:Zn ribbon nucleic-acid-binding protein
MKMSRRKRHRPEPACSRCGNEADLRQWHDGKVYCPSCLDCGCDDSFQKINGTCIKCLRDLHTIMTFEGPRLRDSEVYVHDAFEEYGIRAHELMTWTFEEEEVIESVWEGEKRKASKDGPKMAPPHHRLTSWGGNL